VIPQQPLIDKLQYVPPVVCDWPGCQDASVNTLYGDQQPLADRLTRYCRRHTQETVAGFQQDHQDHRL
jgi:hypothetical protein